VVDPVVAARDESLHRKAVLYAALKVSVLNKADYLVVHAVRQVANSLKWFNEIGFKEMPNDDVNRTTLGQTFSNTTPCFLGTGHGKDTSTHVPKALCGALTNLVRYHQHKALDIADKEASTKRAKFK